MARRWSLEVAPSAVPPVAAAALAENAGEIGGGAGVDVVALRSLIDTGPAPDEARRRLRRRRAVAAAVDSSAADDDSVTRRWRTEFSGCTGPTLVCGELAFYSRRGTTLPGSRDPFFDFYRQRTELCELCMQGRCKTHRRTLLGFRRPARVSKFVSSAVSIRAREPQSAAPLSSRRRWSWRISPRGRSRGYGARRRQATSRPVRFARWSMRVGSERDPSVVLEDDAKGAVRPRRALSSCLVIAVARTVDSKKRSVPRRSACR